MLQAMTYLGQGFSSCLTPINMFCCIIGVLVGTLAGVLPGLGISGSVAILLPITYSMDEPHPVKRTEKKYKVFPASSHSLLAAFYAARQSVCFSIGVRTPRLRWTRLVL